jgi:ACS family tartrate transporter-like MFS transporter
MSTIACETISRLNWRIIPLFIIIYVINFLDRVNVGFAALQMNEELSFTPEIYGFGAGIFFIGYFLFEVPSNMMLTKVGVRYWLARIMVSWGIVAGAMMFVSSPTSFYVLRFLLGVTEAGFVPALLVYLGQWYPQRDRATAVARIWSSTAIAIVIGGPISGLILQMHGLGGLSGWQWMYVIQAVPAVLIGVVLFLLLTDKPEDATWLTREHRSWLVETLAKEEAEKRNNAAHHHFAAAFKDARVWILGFMYMCLGIGFFGVTLWLPQVVRQLSGLTSVQTSFVSAIPFLFAVISMVLVGRHSDRTGERRWHVVIGALVAAVGFVVSGQVENSLVALGAITIGAMGLWSIIAIFWQIPAQFLAGAAQASGLAIINSCGSIGGFIGPFLVGWIRGQSGGFSVALIAIAGSLIVAAIIASLLRFEKSTETVSVTA